MQINNARESDIFVLGQRWDIVDARGQRHTHEVQGFNSRGVQHPVVKVPPSTALRIKCELPQLHTSGAIVSGAFLARFVVAGAEAEADVEDEGELVELIVAPMGASADGGPVPMYKPLAFLEAAALSAASQTRADDLGGEAGE